MINKAKKLAIHAPKIMTKSSFENKEWKKFVFDSLQSFFFNLLFVIHKPTKANSAYTPIAMRLPVINCNKNTSLMMFLANIAVNKSGIVDGVMTNNVVSYSSRSNFRFFLHIESDDFEINPVVSLLAINAEDLGGFMRKNISKNERVINGFILKIF